MARLWHIVFTFETPRAKNMVWFGSVQSLSHVRLFVTPWTTAHQASLSITNSWSLPKLMFIESVMPSNHLILCHHRYLKKKKTFQNKWHYLWSVECEPEPSRSINSFLLLITIIWISQETQTGALYQPRGMGWWGRWEGGSRGRGYMYTYGWFMLRFDRKQQNSVKQLSFSRK